MSENTTIDPEIVRAVNEIYIENSTEDLVIEVQDGSNTSGGNGASFGGGDEIFRKYYSIYRDNYSFRNRTIKLDGSNSTDFLNDDYENDHCNKTNPWIIVLGVIVSLFLIIIMVSVLVYLKKYRNKRSLNVTPSTHTTNDTYL